MEEAGRFSQSPFSSSIVAENARLCSNLISALASLTGISDVDALSASFCSVKKVHIWPIFTEMMLGYYTYLQRDHRGRIADVCPPTYQKSL